MRPPMGADDNPGDDHDDNQDDESEQRTQSFVVHRSLTLSGSFPWKRKMKTESVNREQQNFSVHVHGTDKTLTEDANEPNTIICL
jgi:hypothetical protein